MTAIVHGVGSELHAGDHHHVPDHDHDPHDPHDDYSHDHCHGHQRNDDYEYGHDHRHDDGHDHEQVLISLMLTLPCQTLSFGAKIYICVK